MRLAPSLHRIGSPLVAAYLVEDDRGVTVIDAGMPGYRGLLERELAAIGRSLDDVRGVVLTHGDTDHIGFAEQLRRERAVPVFVHEADAARARREVSKPASGWGPISLPAFTRFLVTTARYGGLRIPGVQAVTTFRDGEILDLPGSPRIVHLPGHTPGSVAVHVPAVDAVFLGDAMTTRNVLTGEAAIQPGPFTLDPQGARASLERLAGIDARWVLPGHGAPTDIGLSALLEVLRARAA